MLNIVSPLVKDLSKLHLLCFCPLLFFAIDLPLYPITSSPSQHKNCSKHLKLFLVSPYKEILFHFDP